ncbi:hypothetical protein HW561_07390 [Rhodobacteraceae bacterium B1Z28]|uniref:Uncharacterized protein n=1 Tax=Ruegeria haliotis TaxID=2747601 RepID=A0ABX2PRA9_9RHOB|nr:hypothetical protein [Ruegeria haliotis]NVO55609.1 hypothetical protein [Ruegeria haliotis]
MTVPNSAKILLLLSLLTVMAPDATLAKPNGYPGENSTFRPLDPAVAAQRKADREKRIELRKKRREERRLKRLNKKNSRSK